MEVSSKIESDIDLVSAPSLSILALSHPMGDAEAAPALEKGNPGLTVHVAAAILAAC